MIFRILCLIGVMGFVVGRSHDAAAAPTPVHASVQVRLLLNADASSKPVRLVKDPRDDTLYYLQANGNIRRITLSSGSGSTSTLVYGPADHTVTSAQGLAIGPDGTIYVVGNTIFKVNSTFATVMKGVPNGGGGRTWSILARTDPYPLSQTAFDHVFNGIIVSPDGQFVLLNSGSRTDHGEEQSLGGAFPGTREVGLTAKIIRLPANSANLVLANNLTTLRSAGYVFAEGIRNTFDFAFAPNGDLFGTENGPDCDMPDELNWLREGLHYGFPWRIGGIDTPQQFPGYDPTQDRLLDSRFPAVQNNFYHNDPGFPPPPTTFQEPVINIGPDADSYRDPADGLIKDASGLGRTLSTFTAHRSPLGLVFDTAGVLDSEFRGHGFVLGWSTGDPNGNSVAGPFNDPSQDLLDLDLTRLGNANYQARVTRIVGGFARPIDAEIIGNHIYVVEYNGNNGIWEVTLPLAPLTGFVTSKVLGTVRNDFSGWVGMKITVGATPLTVSQLGRIFVSGNSGTHNVKLVRASTQTDVPNGSASITMSGGSAGQFKYGTLASAVTLSANTAYYLVSEETAGGDQWANFDTTVTTTAAGTCDGAVYFGSGYPWSVIGNANQTFVPVDLKYATGGPLLPTITVAATDANAAEPGSDTGSFTITRSGNTAGALTVNYAIGGSATAGTDYSSLGSAVTLPIGSSTAILTVSPIDDPTAEGSETVVVTLTANPSYAVGTPGEATVTIADDEPSTSTAFVTSKVLGTVRNDFSGWVGMKITVGATPLTVSQLGRIFVSGNSGTHNVKLVRASTQIDVPNGSVSITMSGGSAGQFKYGTLASAVTLSANTAYYLVSEETAGGDQWANFDTTVTTTAAGTCDGAVYFGSGYPWSVIGNANQTFVPVDLKYATGGPLLPTITVAATDANAAEPGSDTGSFTITRSGNTAGALTVNYAIGGSATAGTDYSSLGSAVTLPIGSSTAILTVSPIDDPTAEGSETVVVTLTANPSYTVGTPGEATVTIADDELSTSTAFVTSKVLGTVRNDFSGWVGMKITVGATPLTVSQLGRIFVSGNSGTHNVKLVRASTQTDVPNGSASITMSGGSAGQFKYGTLASAVTLSANTAYYLVSEETAGGDQWGNFDTTVTTTAAGTCDEAVYFGSGYPWSVIGNANQTFVPVDLKYATGGPPPPPPFVVSVTLGSVRNDFSGWVGMKITVGATPLTVSQLGRIFVSGNSGAHNVKLVRASTQTDVPNGSVSITMSGGIAGQFKYGALASAVTLLANTTYYLVSEETAGGDRWHHFDTTVTTTAAATCDGAVYFGSGYPWSVIGNANQTFVPVDLK